MGTLGSSIRVEMASVPDYDIELGETFHYATETEAIQAARDWASNERDSSFDTREAIVFLRSVANSITFLESGRPAGVDYVFSGDDASDGNVFGSIDSVSIYSRNNKVWLPATANGQAFYLDDPSDEAAPTISLTALKSRITTETAKVNNAITGHKECLIAALQEQRNGRPKLPAFSSEVEYTTTSGHPTTTPLHARDEGRMLGGYINWTTDGPDASLITRTTTDDDTNSENGYTHIFQQSRALPAGRYEVHIWSQSPRFQPCGYVSSNERYKWTFVLEKPPGIVHELFFDPVTIRQAHGRPSTVGANASNGVIKPATFTDSNGASATLGSISYESGTVEIEVTPDNALAGHVVDIIELDGTVSLSLDVFDATVDSPNDTLSWSVSSTPWEDGDLLLVRIREASP